MAFARIHFLGAHTGIFGNREHQIINLHISRIPIIRVFHITDLLVFLIRLQSKRAGTDRFGIDIRRFTGFQQLIGIFSRQQIGKRHAQILQERRTHFVQHKLHGVVIHFFNRFHRSVHTHIGSIGELSRIGLIERMIFIKHPLESKQYVVRIKIAGRFEIIGSLEFHAFAQMESIGFAVFGYLPFLSQRRLNFSRGRFELHQAVVNSVSRGIKGSTIVVLSRIKTTRAAFRTINQSRTSARCRSGTARSTALLLTTAGS